MRFQVCATAHKEKQKDITQTATAEGQRQWDESAVICRLISSDASLFVTVLASHLRKAN